MPQLIDVMWERRGQGDTTVSRAEALSVPAVLKGRNLLCSVSTLPLVQRGPDRTVAANPLFVQLDPDVSNIVTLAQTVEDLIFDGIAWWRITGFGWDGYPAKIQHLAVASVSLQPPAKGPRNPLPSGQEPRGAVVYVDGKPVPAAEIIRFDSPNPALLAVAGRPIRRAILLAQAASSYAEDPQPADYFTPAEGADPADDDEILEMLRAWRESRKKRSTAFVPTALKYNSVSSPSPRDLQLMELQQQASLEIAIALGVDPEDLGVSTTSRSYANIIDRRRDRINDVLSPYMRAITDRLSMGDVTKRGYVVEFDLINYLKSNPTERVAFYREMKAMGAMDVDEIREAEGWPLLAGGQEETPEEEPAEVSAVEPQPEAVEASATALKFGEGPAMVTFDADVTGFTVDREKRTIQGRALPYGKTATKYGQKFGFEAGSLEWSEVGRIKLLRDHDPASAIGKATSLTDARSGFDVAFKVARGPEGDRALELAEDGVLDGLSVGVDFDMVADTAPHPKIKGALLVKRATLREVSLTAMPAFDDARVTRVAASRTEGESPVTDTIEPTTAPAAPAPVPATAGLTLSAEQAAQFAAFLAAQKPAEPEKRDVVDPTRNPAPTGPTFVSEPLPYRFTHEGGRHVFAENADHDFSTDLFAMLRARETGQDFTAEKKRVDALISAAFDVDRTDVTSLNPNQHKPELWQPQMDYATPLWDMVASGTTDGTKFDIPKFNSSSGLVGPATEGTEPAPGAFTATLQTITPTQVWGKVEITRQAWRAGGNPQLSGIIWDQMLREYYEDREAAVATFLNTLTAAADITITGTPASSPDNDDDQVSANDLEMAIAALQFVRGGNRFRAFAVHIDLYKVLARVKDDAGRPLYPMLNPQNANGSAANLFGTLNVAGTVAVPSWALGATGTVAANSWLFDPAKVRGWASAPERLFWDFGATVQGDPLSNIPQLSHVTLGIYGDVAFGNTDINGVRQVIFDPSV